MLSGAACLLAAGVPASTAPDDSTVLLALGLGLLGLGWNLACSAERCSLPTLSCVLSAPRIRGRVDLAAALAGAAGGLMSGMVMSSYSYSVLTLGGGLLALALLPAALRPAARTAQVATST